MKKVVISSIIEQLGQPNAAGRVYSPECFHNLPDEIPLITEEAQKRISNGGQFNVSDIIGKVKPEIKGNELWGEFSISSTHPYGKNLIALIQSGLDTGVIKPRMRGIGTVSPSGEVQDFSMTDVSLCLED